MRRRSPSADAPIETTRHAPWSFGPFAASIMFTAAPGLNRCGGADISVNKI
jgi:hypothetical protein